MITSTTINNALRNPLRKINARAGLYNPASSVDKVFTDSDNINFYSIERVGDENKFFGFGVCQKAKLKLRDIDRELTLPTDTRVDINFGMMDINSNWYKTYPYFYITEVNRDETTNEVSITAYDALHKASTHTVSELNLSTPYTIGEVANACGDALGVGVVLPNTAGAEPYTEVILDNQEYDMITEIRYTLKNDTDTIYISSAADITYVDIGGEYFGGSFGNGTTFPDALFNNYYEDVVRSYWKAGTTVIIGNAGGEMLYAEANITPEVNNPFDLSYEEGANLEGTETLKEILDAIAEATQTIYYISGDNDLVFKRLDVAGEPVLSITKADYYALDSKTNRRLSAITHATELGDNITATTGVSGTEQFVRDNPFWELREDIDILVQDALDRVGGLTINQFDCSWRGNPLLEVGDKIGLVAKDDNFITTFVVNDVIHYDGSLNQQTSWNYTEGEGETASNPATLGEALKQTYARVNKIDKQIDLVASESDANSERLSNLEISTENINATVSKITTETIPNLEGMGDDIATLTEKVDATMSTRDIMLLFTQTYELGTSKVATSTGFTFDEEGLNISKTDSEMSTQITEDGMTVYKNDEVMLEANNEGVLARNLHAENYLIIGKYSRFEDYEKDGEPRTGCFWIGG